jgi:hypothetical protein
MSDLQLSLLMIGALVVGAVYLFNWLQERRLRRRLQQSFGETGDDVLLKDGFGSGPVDGRLEPQLVPAPAPARWDAAPDGSTDADRADPGFDAVLDYVAEISSESVIADAVVGELASRVASCGKPARVSGLDPKRGGWGRWCAAPVLATPGCARDCRS